MNHVTPFPRPVADHAVVALVTGAGAGFTSNLGALRTALGSRDAPRIAVAEPMAEKRSEALRVGAANGLEVVPYAGLAEDAVARGVGGSSPVIVHVDGLLPLARILASPEAASRAVLAYVLVLLPTQVLLAVRMAFLPGVDDEMRMHAASLFGTLALFTRRSGRDAIFGPTGKLGHKLAEPVFRQWNASHLGETLPKVAVGLSAASAPIEVSTDGRRTMSLYVCHHPVGFWDPEMLTREFLTNPPEAILRGEDTVVAEIGPDGVRLHFCRVRGTDGKIALGRGRAIQGGPSTAAESIRRADRLTINERNPVTATG